MPAPRTWKTRAIVLAHFDLGEADRIVTLLTPEVGKVRAIAKGVPARRAASGAASSRSPSSTSSLRAGAASTS